MNKTPIITTAVAALSLASGMLQAQYTDVGGAGTIGDTSLPTSGGTATLPAFSSWGVVGANSTYSSVISPATAVTATGDVILTFKHRFHFEGGPDSAWDGGAVFVSVDGGPYTYVPKANFSSGEYNSIGPSDPTWGSAWTATEVFGGGKSTGYDALEYITSVVNLGPVPIGQTVSVEFRTGWDGSSIRGPVAWEIDSVKLTDGAAVPVDILDKNFNVDGDSGFTTSNTGSGTPVPWAFTTVKTISRFELDATTDTADRYAPDAPAQIDLTGGIFRVSLLNGTLLLGDSFTLFDLSGGSSLTGTPASVSVPGEAIWDTSNLATTGVITVTQMDASGAWNVDSAGNWSDTTKWSGGVVAFGTDTTATLPNIITGNRTITLDSNRTLGNITALDTSHNYTIDGSNILTLDVTVDKPLLTAPNSTSRNLFILTEIRGNDGLRTAGTGVVNIGGPVNDSFSGDIQIDAGTLRIGNNNATSRLGGETYAGNILNNGTLWLSFNGTQTLSGVISGSGIFRRDGQGVVTLTGANTYTGQTIIAGSGAGAPSLSISSFNSVVGGSASSSLGAPTTVANGTIQLGSGSNVRDCTLIYTGSGETTDRVMNVQFNANSKHTIQADTTGLLKFTSPFTITPSSGNTSSGLYLGGSGNGEIAQIGTIPGFLEKKDSGTWTLGGTNAPNAVNVTGGTLAVTGPLTSASSVNVTAATLTVTGPLTSPNTSVTDGLLSLGDGTNNSSLPDSSWLSVSGTGKINLNYSSGSPDAVYVLIIDGVGVPSGNYGNSASGADNGGAGVGAYDAYFTGTGIITTAGGIAPAGEFYWDGGVVNIPGNGNLTSDGGDGTWDATIQNWDIGFQDAHAAWGNTTADKANFGGTPGTVTLGTDLNIGELEISAPAAAGAAYSIGDSAEDNTLTFGGAKTLTVTATGNGTNQDAIIYAGIAGSPDLNITGRGDSNANSFNLLPTSNVTMALGSVNMLNTFGSNKRLILGGESDGNVADSVSWVVTNNQLYLTKAGTGSWTINNDLAFGTVGSTSNLKTSRLYVEQGTLTLGGTNNFFTHKCGVSTTRASSPHAASGLASKLIAKGTFTINDNREYFYVQNAGTIAPGPGVQTLTVRWNANSNNTSTHGQFKMESGSTYEWDVASSTSTDVIDVQTGGSNWANLIYDGMTLKIKDAGVATPINSTDQLTVFTYETGTQTVARSLGSVTFDTSALGAGWTVGDLTLTDDGNGKIYLTGLSYSNASPFDTWKARDGASGVTFDGDVNGDGVKDGLAFLLGAANPNIDAKGLLPTATATGGDLVMTFTCLADSARGTSVLNLEWDGDLTPAWSSVAVPGAVGDTIAPNGTGTVNFAATSGGTNGAGDALINIVATIDDNTEAAAGKLFGRLKAETP